MPDHSYFEELTALAAGGHLSAAEASDLEAHLQTCAACRDAIATYGELMAVGLPLTRTTEVDEGGLVTAGIEGARDRFLARARQEGVRFSPEVEITRPARSWSFPARLAAGLAFATLAIGSAWFLPEIPRRFASANGVPQELEQIKQENARLTAMLQSRDATLVERQDQLRTLQAQLATAAKGSIPAGGGRDVPGFQLGQSRSLEARLLEELQQRDAQLAAAAEEISRINQLRVTDRATLTANQTRLRELSTQLRVARATLDVERELADAGRDVLALLGAKQLRVVDVRDTDANGQPSAAFARIFVTEDRSIRIFAFDLNEGTGAAGRFQVWGEQLGVPGSARSLGTLRVDDRTQNRWNLTLQSEAAVKDINSVFVTAAGTGPTPSGPRLLYALLGRS